jgi:Leucine-rich repeat (LRR) protein
MRQNKQWALVVFFNLLLLITAMAQQPKADTKKHEQKVKDMVAFLEYVLNTLGSSATSARDKDVLITESYTKIFRDSKVQIEDDLVEKRNVITNKDVQAYLKDVDFFFDDLKFEFTIKEIQGKVNANDRLFYKVSLLRNIQGTTVEGKLINNTIPRFIEINYDHKDQDLKIVSIYTNEFDEKGALLTWWKQLSFEWQSIFQRKLNITDSVDLADIKNIASINELDLSNNQYIQDIEPLAQLVGLQGLNLSNTNITDLSPIRNLTDLVDLNVANTKIQDIAALKYSDKLVKLNVSNTGISDISVFEKMVRLEQLEMSSVPVEDFAPLSNLVALKSLNLQATKIDNLSPIDSLIQITELNASKTKVENVNPIKDLKNLTVLNLDSTGVSFLKPLGTLENLKILRLNYTSISDLNALKDLKNLERIYCDQTQVNRELATAFMESKQGVLVIYDSKDLKGWWDSLPIAWQKVFRDAAHTGDLPSNEDLAKITNIDSLNLSDNEALTDLEPLQRFRKLKVLNAKGTGIKTLSPIQEHTGIRSIDISDTEVEDISVLQQFKNLNIVRADRSKISSLEPLSEIKSLTKIYADATPIRDQNVKDFLSKNSDCLVVYKTDSLLGWWNELSESWKEVFKAQVPINSKFRKEDLHRLIELESLEFKESSIDELTALRVFVRLKALKFSGTALTDISPLTHITSIKSLHITNSPLRDISSLSALTDIENLDISNTPVEDLRSLGSLEKLKTLNCSGTQVSSLSPLENLSLESLDCSNTGVKKLSPLFGLPLTTLKCYNTKISSKEIENFKKRIPACNVIYYR